MTSPSEIPSAFLQLPSNGIPWAEIPSTFLEQEHSFPLEIDEPFPYPVPYPEVARRRVFACVSRTWDTHIRILSQIMEASADDSTSLDNTFRPLMPNTVMRSATYLQHVYPQLREKHRPPRYDLIGSSEALDLTGNDSTDRDPVTEEEPSMGEDSDAVEADITGEDSHEQAESNMNNFSLFEQDFSSDGSSREDMEVDAYELCQDEEEVTTYGSVKEEKEISTDTLSHREMDPSSDNSYHEKDSSSNASSQEKQITIKQEPFQEEMEYHNECSLHFNRLADAYESSDEEKVAIKMEHSPEEIDTNIDGSFCEERFVLPVIASTSGSYYQHYAEDSQQGKRIVGRIVSIWTTIA